MATMDLLCWLKLSTLLDCYRAVIIEHIQPIHRVSGYKNCQLCILNDSGSIILEYQIKLQLCSILCTHTPFALIDSHFKFHSVSSLSMAKHQQMNSVGGDVCRVLHVIMHIKIP